MEIVREKQAFYPAFHLGDEPRAVECTLAIVEANGRRYLKTPFAMLDAFADDDIERQIDGWRYYPDAASVESYLAAEYPWWQQAKPIMEALMRGRHYCGDIVGGGRVADSIGVSFDDVYQLARGHKRFTLKTVHKAVRDMESVLHS